MGDNLDFNILRLPNNNDRAYRDAVCMAYICAVLDLPASDFYTKVKNTIKNKIEAEAMLEMLQRDFEIRTRRLLKI